MDQASLAMWWVVIRAACSSTPTGREWCAASPARQINAGRPPAVPGAGSRRARRRGQGGEVEKRQRLFLRRIDHLDGLTPGASKSVSKRVRNASCRRTISLNARRMAAMSSGRSSWSTPAGVGVVGSQPVEEPEAPLRE